jgi:3-hydroxyacyl-CoA dehydrogenase
MAAAIELRWRRRQETGEADFLGDRLAQLGRFGQKVGTGYYGYETNSRVPLPDPEVEEIIREASRREGLRRPELTVEARVTWGSPRAPTGNVPRPPRAAPTAC